MAAKKDETTVETAELTPEIKEEMFTAPIEVIASASEGPEVPVIIHGAYNQNTGEFIR